MLYGSVCSGIEAASVAWHDLGWRPAWFSEIEPFPSAVLAHRFPGVPNLGDMTQIHKTEVFKDAAIELLVGGTPCQSFSVAGLRAGLEDARGNLALAYVGLAARKRPRWLIWENVPGVLSSSAGRDFGAIISALAELGYSLAWRVLDAQYFGVPQRRRRVFLVGSLRSRTAASTVLLEPESLRRHPAQIKDTRHQIAACLTTGVGKRNNPREDTLIPDVAHTLTCARGIQAPDTVTYVPGWPADKASTLNAAFGSKLGLEDQHIRGGAPLFVPDASSLGLRRLTPRECERLQGFPDDWTLIPYRGRPAGDQARYKACGNSMAVPVMRWIGKRIQMLETGELQDAC